MNDSTTIYISHNDDIALHHHEDKSLSSTASAATGQSPSLSKKVAQNRAAQRAFRERKQHYLQDLEKKAKQLDMWKRAMIQLQADNDCLRKTVASLEDQLNKFIAGTITSTPNSARMTTSSSPTSSLSSDESIPLSSPSTPLPTLASTSASISIPSSSSSSSLTSSSTLASPSPSPYSSSSPPSLSPSSPSLSSSPSSSSSFSSTSSSSSSSSSSPSLSSATATTASLSMDTMKRKSTLSKREKKRQRLLADEKLYKNDDLEPIQLHCPLAFNNAPTIQSQPQPYESYEHYDQSLMISHDDPVFLDPFLPSSPPSSVVADVHPLSFSDLPCLDQHDQYINFVEDDFPSSSSSSCSSYVPLC